jgi:hypothetical protein
MILDFGFWILDLKRKKSSLRLRRSPWFAFAALRPCGMRFADFGVPLRAAGALPALHSGHAGCAARNAGAATSGRGIVVLG